MPLEKGSSKEVISKNIAELEKSYHKKGTLGNSKPANAKKAAKQAAAIAYAKAGKGKPSVKESFVNTFNSLFLKYS